MNIFRRLKFGSQFLFKNITGVGIILTRRCNLQCPYCNVIKNNNGIELGVEQWKKIIDNFRKNGHLQFVFNGGEPFLYDGLFELVDFTSQKSLTSIITNGTFLDNEALKRLKNLDFLNLSLDTFVDDDDISFKHNLSLLETARDFKHRYKKCISVIITVTKKNVNQVIPLIKLISKCGFTTQISLIHSGKGYWYRSYAPFLDFTNDEDFKRLSLLQAELIKLKKQNYEIVQSVPFLKQIVNFKRNKFRAECYAGERAFSVNNDGYIMPCHDCCPSDVSALDFKDYNAMKKRVKEFARPDCSCFYDCVFNISYMKNHPVSFVRDIALKR